MKYSLLLMLFPLAVFATNKPTQDQDQKQLQDQSQYVKTSQDVVVNIGGEGQPLVTTNAAPTTLTSEDNSSLEFNTSNESHNTVMVPNNNTEGCLRVFGLGFPTSQGSVVMGIPWRSQTCDLKDASKDAFAQGNLMLGWMLKCKMKAMRKAFGSEQKCLDNVIEISALTTEIDRLRGDMRLMEIEQSTQRAECEESTDRVFEACVAK